MIIQKTYKTELKPNKKQKTLLKKSVGTARFAYNWGLRERIDLYEKEKKSLSAIDQHKILCAKKKKDFPWMYDVSKCAPQEALRNLDQAFKNFFRRLKKGEKPGFPKFKKKHVSKQSFRINSKCYVTKSSIKIPRVGEIRLKEKGYIKVKDVSYKSVTVSKDVDRWFVSVHVEENIPDPDSKKETVIGIDLGISNLAICSNGDIYKNPKSIIKSAKKLAFAQKNLARKKINKKTKRSSNNRKKAKVKVQKIYRRIRNQRKDSIHKMTSILVKTKPRYIVIEDLDVSGMLKNHRLARSIADASFFEINRQLLYKTKWYGGEILEADRFFPSSKTCCLCKKIKEDLTLGDRVFNCTCGNKLDRDLNAAINLEQFGLEKLKDTESPSGIKACGESVRLDLTSCRLSQAISMKQEENTKFNHC